MAKLKRDFPVVAGIYIERDGGALLRAKVSVDGVSGKSSLIYLDKEYVSWNPVSRSEATNGISRLAALSVHDGTEIKRIAVACYGPFVSLNKSSRDYGKKETGIDDNPLEGADIRKIIADELEGEDPDIKDKISVHTDSNACAVGESVIREVKDSDHLLAFLIVSNGVGQGLVRGNAIVKTALHSEIGLISCRIMPDDTLKPEKGAMQFSRGLEELSSNVSMLRRLEMKRPQKRCVEQDLLAYFDEDLWNTRAYYLAQACMAIMAISPPHQIVIGATLDPHEDIGSRVGRYFREHMDNRLKHDQPVLRYHQDISKFITTSGCGGKLHKVGVIGMCYTAAMALNA